MSGKKLAIAMAALAATGAMHPAAGLQPAEQEEVIRLHTLNSAKLREIMQSIQQWTRENSAADLQQPGMDRELVDGLLDRIEELLYHAELMSIGMPVTNLDSNEMVIFKALASELYTQGIHLQQLVNNRQLRQLDTAYQQMRETCQACHGLFRHGQGVE